MSEPKRYAWKVNEENDFDLIEHPEGEFVLHSDYARLHSEVERLRAGVETMTYHAPGVETTQWVRAVEYDRLKAQVERLTKAGGNLVYVVSEHPSAEPFVKGWFAAKEGKQ